MAESVAIPPQSALVIGGTGAVGHILLKEVLDSPHFTRVGEYGRHVTDEAKLPESARGKLEQRVVDFEQLDQAALRAGRWDVVFITLGATAAAAGSDAEFEKIDRDYVLTAARAAKSEDPAHKQKLIYLSCAGVDPSSTKLYQKSKALTEQGLAELGYDDFIVFRPAWFTGALREHGRFGELMLRPFIGFASLFSASVSIPVPTLAKALRIAGDLGTPGLRAEDKAEGAWGGREFTVVSNASAKLVTQRVYM